MAQVLFKIKEVLEWVKQNRIKSSFTDCLDACADLVFDEVQHGMLQSGWDLKAEFRTITGHEEWLKPVTTSLINAYEAYYADKSCPLIYVMYVQFVSGCRAWGTFVFNLSLQWGCVHRHSS